MEMQANAAATSAQEGDLADVVARANIAVSSSSTSHQQLRPSPPASAHKMVPYEEQRQRHMSVACGVGDTAMLEAVPLSAVVLDPYLLPETGSYVLPQQQHQQLLAFQISEQASCGASVGDLDAGEDALGFSPPSAPPHQMINSDCGMPCAHIPYSRKNDVRKVVCIPAPPAMSNRAGGGGEVIPSDLWAWRKYGQKPIKGSPYPRGYYRCSSSKGCMARKQVERSRSDPNMLVITYTAEHHHPWPMHRNVLAGYARGQSTHATTSVKKQKITELTDNVTNSSPSNHNNIHPEQNMMRYGDKTASNSMRVAMGGDGSTGIGKGGGLINELAYNGIVQPDEVFAELEELEPENSSLMISANVYSMGVSSNYEWHKL